MTTSETIWAVVPIKQLAQAKQRLAGRLSEQERRQLVLAMAEDVLDALSTVQELAGILVVTADPLVARTAIHHGARVSDTQARDGLTAAVMAAARHLAAKGHGMLAVPADIPALSEADIRAILVKHRQAPSFTIVPARDFQGSNAILASPADVVPLQFGVNSFYTHLAAAKSRGLEPLVLLRPTIGLDIDNADDLATFEKFRGNRRSTALLARWARGNMRGEKTVRVTT
jgi:2-phospho-L-lactate/phosphoenolpyruvate guanylyltransferase